MKLEETREKEKKVWGRVINGGGREMVWLWAWGGVLMNMWELSLSLWEYLFSKFLVDEDVTWSHACKKLFYCFFFSLTQPSSMLSWIFYIYIYGHTLYHWLIMVFYEGETNKGRGNNNWRYYYFLSQPDSETDGFWGQGVTAAEQKSFGRRREINKKEIVRSMVVSRRNVVDILISGGA